MHFPREAELELERWLGRKQRKPLVIRGARQVGKSTLVRRFAAEHRLTLVEINLERHRQLDRLFAANQTHEAVAELEVIGGGSLATKSGGRPLLFLDEIQATPHALPFLRYLAEDFPELPVVSAGSLLEFLLRDHGFSMPVGRIEYLHLGPLTFAEFAAAGVPGAGGHTAALLKGAAQASAKKPVPDAAHRALVRLLKDYFLVGGMPEAVAEYAGLGSLAAVGPVHHAILATYKDDFAKYAHGHAALLELHTVLHRVPSLIGQKVKYSNIDPASGSREVKKALELLTLARVIAKVHHSDGEGVPLESGVDQRAFKLLYLDIGLLCAALGIDAQELTGLDDVRFVNQGALAEQFVGQHLLYRGPPYTEPRLHYWLREGKRDNAEVDYVIAQGSRIVPIEVKSGTSGTLKSLHEFMALRRLPCAVRMDLGPMSSQIVTHARSDGKPVRYQLLSVPLYMIGELPRLITEMEV